MTAVQTDKLPEFEGASVAYSAIKFSGTATGFSEGLRIAPVAYSNGDDVYLVVRATVAAVDHPLDKDENTFRRHDLKIADMAPIDKDTATKTIVEYLAQIQRLKDEAEGKQQLDFEQAAEEREDTDGWDTPSSIADAAAKRAKA